MAFPQQYPPLYPPNPSNRVYSLRLPTSVGLAAVLLLACGFGFVATLILMNDCRLHNVFFHHSGKLPPHCQKSENIDVLQRQIAAAHAAREAADQRRLEATEALNRTRQLLEQTDQARLLALKEKAQSDAQRMEWESVRQKLETQLSLLASRSANDQRTIHNLRQQLKLEQAKPPREIIKEIVKFDQERVNELQRKIQHNDDVIRRLQAEIDRLRGPPSSLLPRRPW